MSQSRSCPVAVIDYGSQYTQLIARKVREEQVYCEIFPHRVTAADLAARGVRAVVLSGGPNSVYDAGAPGIDPAILGAGWPVLGICYGMQLAVRELGGSVARIAGAREYGHAEAVVEEHGPAGVLFRGLAPGQKVWMSHGDSVERLPEGFVPVARTAGAIAAAADPARRLHLVQFHPEVVHTENGKAILRNFLFQVAGLAADWDMGSFVEKTVAELRARVGDKTVVCGISGGVDSTVMAVLLHRALGDRLRCIFVDNGLLRKNERTSVEERFRRHLAMPIETVDGTDRFLDALAGVADPEEKRKCIGQTFVDLFFANAGDFDFLAQGTLYPDVIESGGKQGGPAATIKTHHNRVARIHELIAEGRVVEPFADLFKDEVRAIGRLLGLPDEILLRQPFPGPGLGIRIIGAVTRPKLDLLREADEIVVGEIKAAGLYHTAWQSFCVLLPIHSVGVMGDERTYDNVLAVRSVESSDGMTSQWSRLPYDLLERISRRVINEVKGINRVVYDISSKPPATIEWE